VYRLRRCGCQLEVEPAHVFDGTVAASRRKSRRIGDLAVLTVMFEATVLQAKVRMSSARQVLAIASDPVSVAVIEALWQRPETGHESTVAELRAATADVRSRFGGGHRFPAALATLERSGLLWVMRTMDTSTRKRHRVGLTQHAIQMLRREGTVDG
jgi:hypothetical protein